MFQKAAAAEEDPALNFIRKHAVDMKGEVGTGTTPYRPPHHPHAFRALVNTVKLRGPRPSK